MREIIEFRAWKKWFTDRGRCQASTKAGTQCKNQCHGYGTDICNEDDFYEVEFILGVTDRCQVHCLQVPEPVANPEEIKRLLALLESCPP